MNFRSKCRRVAAAECEAERNQKVFDGEFQCWRLRRLVVKVAEKVVATDVVTLADGRSERKLHRLRSGNSVALIKVSLGLELKT